MLDLFHPDYGRLVERALERAAQLSESPDLRAAMAGALFSGGKRVRPRLTLLCAALAGEVRCSWDDVADVGAAMEIVHCASLLLDDLPCMDGALTRRGQPAGYLTHGPAVAILAAHSLVCLAFERVTDAGLCDGQVRRIVRELSVAIGASGLARGQVEDLTLGTTQTPSTVAALKTGVLFGAACAGGAIAGGADEARCVRFRQLGLAIGTAFQVADDFVDHAAREDQHTSSNVVDQLGGRRAMQVLEERIEFADGILRALGGTSQLAPLYAAMRKIGAQVHLPACPSAARHAPCAVACDRSAVGASAQAAAL